MARVVEGFHSFTCTSTRLCTNGVNHTCLCLLSRSWLSFIDPGGIKGWVDLSTTTVSKSAQHRYVTDITVVSCSRRHTSLGNWSTGRVELTISWAASGDANHRVTQTKNAVCTMPATQRRHFLYTSSVCVQRALWLHVDKKTNDDNVHDDMVMETVLLVSCE